MFSDTTLNRIYDRGSSVYNYSLGGEGFTEATKRRTDTRNERSESNDNLDDAFIPEIEHAGED